MDTVASETAIRVTAHSSGPYIKLPKDQVDRVRKVLERNLVKHWVKHISISVDGGPFISTIYIDRRADAANIQAMLDAA